MSIQETKEMIRRAIKILDGLGQETADLKAEFVELFKEEV